MDLSYLNTQGKRLWQDFGLICTKMLNYYYLCYVILLVHYS